MTAILTDQLKTTTRTAPVVSAEATAALPALLIEGVSKSFVVGRKARGAGVAKTLLDAAIDYARDQGATLLEAYPVEVASGERARPGDLYRGTLSMFERAGFTVAERRPTPGGAPRPIVRRAIRPRRAR